MRICGLVVLFLGNYTCLRHAHQPALDLLHITAFPKHCVVYEKHCKFMISKQSLNVSDLEKKA